jgi:serine/threonine protein kinase
LVRTITYQLATLFIYIHSEGFVYSDLKASNVFLQTDGSIKLVDFGYCKKLEPEQRRYTVCGTRHAMAPEIFAHEF